MTLLTFDEYMSKHAPQPGPRLDAGTAHRYPPLSVAIAVFGRAPQLVECIHPASAIVFVPRRYPGSVDGFKLTHWCRACCASAPNLQAAPPSYRQRLD